MLGDIWSIGERALGGGADDKLFTDVQKAVGEASEAAGGLLAAKADKSPPKEIQALRDAFEETLEELGVTLVVLIDDLDRRSEEHTSELQSLMRISYAVFF